MEEHSTRSTLCSGLVRKIFSLCCSPIFALSRAICTSVYHHFRQAISQATGLIFSLRYVMRGVTQRGNSESTKVFHFFTRSGTNLIAFLSSRIIKIWSDGETPTTRYVIQRPKCVVLGPTSTFEFDGPSIFSLKDLHRTNSTNSTNLIPHLTDSAQHILLQLLLA